MTWNTLAEDLGISLIDLVGDSEETEDLSDTSIYKCYALDSLVDNMGHEEMPLLRAINASIQAIGEQPYAIPYR